MKASRKSINSQNITDSPKSWVLGSGIRDCYSAVAEDLFTYLFDMQTNFIGYQ